MAKKPTPLPTTNYLRECFDLDAERGVLIWRSRPREHFKDSHQMNAWNARYAGKEAGTTVRSGVNVRLRKVHYFVHRIVFALTHGAEPPAGLDHRDLDNHNNRPGNLRPATKSQNSMNTRAPKTNTSGFKGVSRHGKSGYRAVIKANGKFKHLGTFRTKEEAAESYRQASAKLHGEFARVA